MPTVAIFYGIVVQFYWTEHPPPHFHARYAGEEAQIDIRKVKVLNGSLPKRALAMVLEWTRVHQAELLEAWDAARAGQAPARIAPLP